MEEIIRASIISVRSYEGEYGYTSWVRVLGSKHSCASFWGKDKAEVIAAAKEYLARYNMKEEQ